MSRLDAQQKLDELHLVASSLNKEITMKANPTRAQLHQCIAECTMTRDFSNSLILSSNCSRRISSYACMMRITIYYELSSYQIDFLTTGSENDPNTDLVTSIVQQNILVLYGITVAIDIARTRFFPGPSLTDGDGFSFFCNRDRCNSRNAENSVHSIIHNHNSLLDIIEPLTTTTPTTPHVSSTTSHGNQVTAAHNGCVIILLSIGILCQYFQKYLYY
ncbi:unnamed protein product [Rotaria sordida]|uniref:Uncharacterized protein n=1 Tax=Rotaria sordida TaxID=392033 RepID=A0A815AEL1_9BILA|nr:unnamed protein product [Rotaria sordida]CAF1283363.1 unnamed protein product [Rotaria sordida]CAF1399648.1 unnamed protein product [Rotaria sordida]CAF1536825.1 unnamed protein product [Rotaria sordida]